MNEKTALISAKEFCVHHSVSYSFISGLQDAGLIEIHTFEHEQYIQEDDLGQLEKLIRLHTELEINPEGVEAIAHLLQQVEDLQQTVQMLTQKLNKYE